METKLFVDGFSQICKETKLPNKFVVKKPGWDGRLAMLWKNDVNLRVINFSDHHILANVVKENGRVWFLIGFYGWSEASQKSKSWALLNHIKSLDKGAWLCISDFNAILSSTQKLSLRALNPWQIDDFREALEQFQLVDLGHRGYPYTWNNRRLGDANTRERLDHAVASKAWRTIFPRSNVTHLHTHASDQLPILLNILDDNHMHVRGPHGFKFEESWLMWAGCEDVVIEAWGSGIVGGSTLDVIRQQIAICGRDLHAWGASKTHPDKGEIKHLQNWLATLDHGPSTEQARNEFVELSKTLDDLLRKQEIYWHQRARIAWMKHDYKNTKFFHAKASQRRKRNFIQGMMDQQG